MRSLRLFRRVFVCYIVALSILILGWIWWGNYALNQLRSQEKTTQLHQLTHAFIAASVDEPTAANQPQLQQLLNRLSETSDTRLIVVTQAGEVLADAATDSAELKSFSSKPDILAVLTGQRSSVERVEAVIDPWIIKGKIVAAVRASFITQNASPGTGRSSWGWMTMLCILLVSGGYAVLRMLFSPLEDTAKHAELLADGKWKGKFAYGETTELVKITEAFNYLIDQLEERSHAIGRQGTEHEAVLGSMVEGVLAVDSEGHLITLNRAAAALTETERNEAVGKNLTTVIRNADLRRFMVRALESPNPVEDDITFLGQRNRVLQVRGTALYDGKGNSIGAVIVLNDVTHTRHLESVRRDFVANVSHELKTPISSIKGFVETLLDGAMNNPADAERFLRIIAKQADRLDTIIEDLLSLSKIEQSEQSQSLQLEQSKVLDVLATVVNDYQSRASEKNIAINVECDENLVAALNPHLLVQAVGNLVDNALKYSDANSSVDIAAERTDDAVVISVRDHGCGIDTDHLPRLFERFYRVDKARSRKLGGTGLGLAIVKHIVQAHGGRVDVQSVPGNGSTFRIYLQK